MGLLSKLFGGSDGDSSDECPWCGEPMSGVEHLDCGVDQLVARSSSSLSSGGSDDCEACQASLDDGIRYLPYEDGSNSHAYIICPSCNHENIRYGFGEDD